MSSSGRVDCVSRRPRGQGPGELSTADHDHNTRRRDRNSRVTGSTEPRHTSQNSTDNVSLRYTRRGKATVHEAVGVETIVSPT